MSLRLQVNLIVTVLLLVLSSLLLGLQIHNTRRGVHEEVVGANVVAMQLLARVEWVYGQGGVEAMAAFLRRVGRIRASEVELYDAQGTPLYRSPAPSYKAGREAPRWYAALVSPPLPPREIVLPGGRLVLRADPSRAVLDGWDELQPLLWAVLAGFLLVNALVYALLGRVLRPVRLVAQALHGIERGAYDTRLPVLTGSEGRLLSQAFNRMAQAVHDSDRAQRQAREARLALAQNRELTRLIQQRVEQERGAIARELHDELGQQVTAIKSIALSIAHRAQAQDAQTADAARLVTQCADRIYDGMHRLVARLRPLALEHASLRDALHELVADARVQAPDTALALTIEGAPETLDEARASALYRIAQEALTNALRHAGAGRIALALRVDSQGGALLEIADDGAGRPERFEAEGHYGVPGMRERAQALGGSFFIGPAAPTGVRVRVQLPAPVADGQGEQA